MSITLFLRIFVPLAVAIDCLGLLPIFISSTGRLPAERRRQLCFESVGAAFAITMGFMLVGAALFDLLRITVADFQIAGGLILLVLAILDLLLPGKPAVDDTHTVGIVPLAMPLIAGPATMTTSLVLVQSYGYGWVALGLAVNFGLLLIVLLSANRFVKLVGVHALAAMSKLIMLLLAAIAISFIRVGVGDLLQQFNHR